MVRPGGPTGEAPALDLTEQEARRRFARASVARLATVTEAGRPHIVPVTFAVDGEHIYIAVDAKPKKIRQLRKLRNVHRHPRAAVLADCYADDLGCAAAPSANLARDPALPGHGPDSPRRWVCG
jgi:Pyridoxamine 5'-phosphate oxidase